MPTGSPLGREQCTFSLPPTSSGLPQGLRRITETLWDCTTMLCHRASHGRGRERRGRALATDAPLTGGSLRRGSVGDAEASDGRPRNLWKGDGRRGSAGTRRREAAKEWGMGRGTVTCRGRTETGVARPARDDFLLIHTTIVYRPHIAHVGTPTPRVPAAPAATAAAPGPVAAPDGRSQCPPPQSAPAPAPGHVSDPSSP